MFFLKVVLADSVVLRTGQTICRACSLSWSDSKSYYIVSYVIN